MPSMQKWIAPFLGVFCWPELRLLQELTTSRSDGKSTSNVACRAMDSPARVTGLWHLH